MTVGEPFSKGATCIRDANTDRPRNMTPRQEPMTTSVLRALRHSGTLKAETPFEMASTPVTAAPPWEKARNTTSSVAPLRMPDPPAPNGTTPSTLL